ncbi:tropomyosin [Tulasnella sp. 417]|nr:tropomyosin [Tulasnella sp. 417]
MSRRLDKPLAVLSPTAAGKKAAGTVAAVSGDRGSARGVATAEQTPGRVFSPNHLPPTSPSPAITSIPKSPFNSTSPPTASAPTGAMDAIRAKLAALRTEADNAVDRAEAAEAKNKKYEQELLVKDQEIASLTHKLGVMEGDLDKAETKLADLKKADADGEAGRSTNDALSRKVALLEEELDTAEKTTKETVDKYVVPCSIRNSLLNNALRQVDVKAEHFERQVQRLEQERDQWEQKYEEAMGKYKQSQKELDELVRSMEGI